MFKWSDQEFFKIIIHTLRTLIEKKTMYEKNGLYKWENSKSHKEKLEINSHEEYLW